MRAFLVLVLFFSILAFMLPFIFGFILIMAISGFILLLLAKAGLFKRPSRNGAGPFRVYTFSTASSRKTGRESKKRQIVFDEEPPNERNAEDANDTEKDEVWYQSVQEGEIITLPETALKKEDE